MRGLSLRALAERLSVSVSYNALHKYEMGAMLPDSGVLRALTLTLDQSMEFFFRPFTVSLATIEFRKKSALGAREVAALREEAADWFERCLEVEEALGIASEFKNPVEHLTVREFADTEKAAEQVRTAWKLGLDTLGNVVELLERQQIKVCLIEGPLDFDGFSGWSGKAPVMVLNAAAEFLPVRRRLTALHELGHLILKFGSHLDAKAREKLCHRFAGAMLMPREVFRREFGGVRHTVSLKELMDIKANYGISIAAIMARAHDLELVSDRDYTSFCIRVNREGWRKNEPGKYRGQERSQRFDQLLHRAVTTEALSMTLAASLARKPLAEFQKGLQVVP